MEYKGYYAIISEVLQKDELREHLRALFSWYRQLETYALSPSRRVGVTGETAALAALSVAMGDGLALMALADEAFDPNPAFGMWEALLDQYFSHRESSGATSDLQHAGSDAPASPELDDGRGQDASRTSSQHVLPHTGTPEWTHEGLHGRDGRLMIAGRDALDLAGQHGTPLYVYDVRHVVDQLRRVSSALGETGCAYAIRLALAAQSEPQVLSAVRVFGSNGSETTVGIQASSLHEVERALTNGWSGDEINFIGASATDAELDAVMAHGARITVGLLTQLNRVGEHHPGASVGICISPDACDKPSLSGQAPQSGHARTLTAPFCIHRQQLDEALEIADRHSLSIEAAHFRVAEPMLNGNLSSFSADVENASQIIQHLRDSGSRITEVSVGGAFRAPMARGERALNLDRWAAILKEHLGDLGATIIVECSEYAAGNSAILLSRAICVESFPGSTLVCLDVDPAMTPALLFRNEHVAIVKCATLNATPIQRVTFIGNTLGMTDVFAQDYPFPQVSEGDVVALVGVGAYWQSAACTGGLRPSASAVFFQDRC